MNAGSASMRAVGDSAVRLDVGPQDRHAVAALARAAALPGVLDVVPGERSVLVRFAPGADLDAAMTILASFGGSVGESAQSIERATRAEVVIPVRYDGSDLDDVAGLTGLQRNDVVSRHLAGRYVVAFLGFMPGFAYLDGLDSALRVPRLATPRARVDAGAVGIADARSCVYPRSSPGGWRIIGRTDARLWDVDRDPPALLAPGTRVRFVAG